MQCTVETLTRPHAITLVSTCHYTLHMPLHSQGEGLTGPLEGTLFICYGDLSHVCGIGANWHMDFYGLEREGVVLLLLVNLLLLN